MCVDDLEYTNLGQQATAGRVKTATCDSIHTSEDVMIIPGRRLGGNDTRSLNRNVSIAADAHAP